MLRDRKRLSGQRAIMQLKREVTDKDRYLVVNACTPFLICNDCAHLTSFQSRDTNKSAARWQVFVFEEIACR